jgi:dephospho-CoA kinase
MTHRRVRRLGLTGGIGSGKSTVAALLTGLGATLVDTDAIARQLASPGGAAIEALRAAFGSALIDSSGALDRERMRELAFGSGDAKQRLESILHPMIANEVQRREREIGDGVIVFDVPLLAESRHWRARVERVLVVDCETPTQVERVVQRNGWDRGVVERIIARQASRAQRRRCADALIYNDGLSMHDLAREVEALWLRWCAPA